MRLTGVIVLALIVSTGPCLRPARAQYPRTRSGGAPVGRGYAPSTSSAREADLLRPYGSNHARSAANDDRSGYTRRPPLQPKLPPPPSQPVARSVHNYFPGMRPGQSPNANIGPRVHCVPSRSSLMYAGR